MIDLEYQYYRKRSDDEYVSADDCFRALTQEQRERVENSTTILSFSKRETIIKQGYVASHVLYIESGLVKLDVTNDMKTSTVRLLGEGAFVGIVCSFACRSLDFSAVALEPTVIRMINMDVFQELIKTNGEFSLKLIRHMSFGTNSMVHWMSRLSGKNVEGSLAIILKEFADIYQSSNFTLPVTRVGLAALAGCSKESVIHALNQFNTDGILKVRDKNISILDQDMLDMIIRNG